MSASAPHPVYRSLVHLYPRGFRGEYGDDLAQHFADLVGDRGARAAWTRTALDLIVTVPRYRLESIMSEPRSTTTLNIAIVLLMTGGVASVMTGVGPGLVLFLAAAVLVVSQRSTLARAIRTPDSNRRRHRLNVAAILGLIFVVTYTAYLALIGDSWTVRETALSLVGTSAMVGAVVYLILGLLTPKDPDKSRASSVA